MCSLSRVKGGVERCGACHACPVLRGRRGLLVACVGVGGLRFLGVAGGYWRVVGEGFPPPLFLFAACFWFVFRGCGGERGCVCRVFA